MGVLSVKEEFIGFFRAILFFIAVVSGFLGAGFYWALLEWTGTIFGINNNNDFANSHSWSFVALLLLGTACFGIAYVSKTIFNKLRIKPTPSRNLEQSVPYVAYGKWLKIAIIPKKDR